MLSMPDRWSYPLNGSFIDRKAASMISMPMLLSVLISFSISKLSLCVDRIGVNIDCRCRFRTSARSFGAIVVMVERGVAVSIGLDSLALALLLSSILCSPTTVVCGLFVVIGFVIDSAVTALNDAGNVTSTTATINDTAIA